MTNDEARFITADGKAHSGNDTWWEQEFDTYERLGIPTELINLARPLLDGNGKEQRFAHEFLMNRQGTWHADAKDLGSLTKVLSERGHAIPTVSDPTENDILDAWDRDLGPADRGDASFSLGTSKEAQRNGLAQHGYPSGAGKATSQPSEGKQYNVAHFGD